MACPEDRVDLPQLTWVILNLKDSIFLYTKFRQREMNLSSDEEIAGDDEQMLNKRACSTEKTMTKLSTEGLTKEELQNFEASLKGKSTISFTRKDF